MKRLFNLLLVFVSVLILVSAARHVSAQSLRDGFITRYSSALIVTPINTAVDIAPQSNFDLVFSASAEYSVRKTDHLAYVFAVGYYPYFNRTEGLVSFSLRTFFKKSEAPIGAFFDWSAIAGVEDDRATLDHPTPDTQPLFGLGLRLGSLRASRFTSLGFEYGAGTSVVLIGGQPRFRAQLFFGLGFLLGKEVLVN